MSLMERIYYRSLLEMSYPEQASLIDKIRAMRTSALNSALIKTQKITKSAIKNISKNSGTKKGKKMLADPTKAASDLLSKLTPEQIALIKMQFKNN